jgi:conjugative relaxase-like TrwC/TraI family protein
MLRIIQNQHADGAKNYYSVADYYTEGQELTGRWRGEGAALLGLTGLIDKRDWDALCDQLDPRTGEQLIARRKVNRTVGYDFNFHVPKSVSLLYALSDDDRILHAFRDSVDETMRDVELEMKTRVRKSGQNEDRTTGNMVWGEFVHFTSRPVDGVPDPHLHAHCFVQNVTFDAVEGVWKAGQFRDVKRDAPYFEALFHTRLAHRLTELGLSVERKGRKDWEIVGVPHSAIEKFSRRTAEIEEKAKELGVEDVESKSELGAKTRSRKVTQLTMPELRAEWRSRLSEAEQDAISQVDTQLGGGAMKRDVLAASRGVNFALAHHFERQSVVPERVLLTTAMRQALGEGSVRDVHQAFSSKELLIHERKGRRMATTREVLDEESRIIDFARQGRGTRRPFIRGKRAFQRAWLNSSQRKAVEHILGSQDRVILVRGAAGVGKTSLMQETVEAIEASGAKVLAFAPTAAASRGVLRSEGFSSADTVARLLQDETLQRAAAGQLIWIDEAGLIGARTMHDVFALADRIDARVLLTGDRRQHGSVARGAVLRMLETEAGVPTAEVTEIQRQKGHRQYKQAIEALAEGRTAEGFDRIDSLGWIHEIPTSERYRQLAADYVQTVEQGKSALVVSPTHAEGDRITDEIRRRLTEAGLLKSSRRPFLQLTNAQLTEAERGDDSNYAPGDVIQFHQNAQGHRRGERLLVDGQSLPLEQAARFNVFHQSHIELAPGDVVRITNNGFTSDGKHRLDNGSLYRVARFDKQGNIVLANGWTVARDYGHLAYGYCVTSHSSQGKTVDRVFIGQSTASLPATSREQFYVSCSRGRESVTVYCDDKQRLREAVTRSDERITATELLHGQLVRDMAAVQRRYAEISHPLAWEQERRSSPILEREELTHGR